MSAREGLVVRRIAVSYGRNHLLRGIDFAIAPGETLVLFGPSGTGKTVLLRAIAGLEPAARGEVWIDGRDVSALGPEARATGMAFQNFALYPHMSARENIRSPLAARGVGKAETEQKIAKIAELLRIQHVLDHAPRELSNGQKQRTALARALVGEPRILLLDDPLRNVDAKLRYEMRLELPRLLRAAGAATIYVTQDYREAMALGDRVAILLDGVIRQIDTPEAIYDRPATIAIARLFGDPPINLFPLRPQVGAGGARMEIGGLALPMAEDESGEGRVLGLRPETITLHREGLSGAVRATLIAITPLHERVVLLLRLASGEEMVASVTGAPPEPGSDVWITADGARALLFDAASGMRIAAGPVREMVA